MVRLVLMTDFTESYGYNILSGILSYAGRSWLINKMPPAFKQRYGFNAVLKWAMDWKADAIIGRFDPEDPVELFEKNGIIAIAQDYKQRFSKIPNITGGYIETGELAADFFLGKGFRNFAYYGHNNIVWSEERRMGFTGRLGSRGIKPEFIHILNDDIFSEELADYSESVADWIKNLPKPIAIFCCDDNQASNLIDICNWKGYKIPEEIAVLGVDNSEIASNLTNPPLSSISLDTANAAFQAARSIERAVNGDKYWDRSDLLVRPISVIGRLSSDNFPTDDEIIVKALKYISQNYMYHINVADVVEQVPISRRVLEVRFRRETGKSILQYINDMRMDRFAKLLIDSDDSIMNLAALVGFDEPSNIARVFKRTFGMTPNKYRKDKSRK